MKRIRIKEENNAEIVWETLDLKENKKKIIRNDLLVMCLMLLFLLSINIPNKFSEKIFR